MEFKGTFEVSASANDVFNFLMDVDKLSLCIPGLQSVEKISKEEFNVLVRVGVAFIKDDFTIKFKVVESDTGKHARLRGNGTGKNGTVDLDAVMDLTELSGKTTMQWSANVNVGGKIGSLGQRVMAGQAEKIIKEMFDCIERSLSSDKASN
ncbi:MAG: carbon monoxide dehydrogenase subunit G [Thermoplasmatales archaeon]